MVEPLSTLRTGTRKRLTEADLKCYDTNGYVLPALRAIRLEEAKAIRAEVEAVERCERKPAGAALAHGHVRYPWLYRLASCPAILDAVEDLIGRDILIWSVSLFVKEAGSNAYIGWHQDCNYWGIEPYDGVVTAWVALSDVGSNSGPMKFLKGSHLNDPQPQEDTYDPDNLLTRGQEIKWTAPIDEEDVAQATMSAGEFSLHHIKIAHYSGVNRGADRRIGVAIRYMPTCTRTVNSTDVAMLVRGHDAYGHFELQQPPQSADDCNSLQQHKRGLEIKQAVTMADTDPEKVAKKRHLASDRNQPRHLEIS